MAWARTPSVRRRSAAGSTSALRYYEGIGLVEPSIRTDAGYRLYDDDTLARLGFIARAKQLGCSLEEILDLAGIWDGEQCVRSRSVSTIWDKLGAAERQIAELTRWPISSDTPPTSWPRPPVNGPCDEGCACAALDTALAPVRLGTRGGVGEPHTSRTPAAPHPCTIESGEIPERLAVLGLLLAPI